MGTHSDKKIVVDIFSNLKKHGFKINDTMQITLNELLKDGYYTYNSFDTGEIDKHIIKMLSVEITDDTLMHETTEILDEIKTKCEYERVVYSIEKLKLWLHRVYIDGGSPEASNAKKQFNKAKVRILKDLALLQSLNYAVPVSDIEKKVSHIHFNRPRYDVLTKHTAIELNKKTLYNELITFCGTGKQRASKIKKILNKLVL
jgi:hypothetical protein